MGMFKTGTYAQMMGDTHFQNAASTTDQEFIPRAEDNMKMGVFRSAPPGDGLPGYAPGCICLAATNKNIFINEGTSAVCDFNHSLGTDFEAAGIKADVIAESTAATGVTVDSVLNKDGLLFTDVVSAGRPSVPFRLNALFSKYRLEWIAGQRGKPGINADILDTTEATRMIADPDFELLGTSAVSAQSAYNAEGGIVLTTVGAAGDQTILVPHLDASQSAWGTVTWGTDQEVIWEARILTPADITNIVLWAGLKLSMTEVTATDANQAFFRFAPGTNAGKFEAVSSVANVDSEDDSGVLVVASTNYHLAIAISAARIATFYINGVLVATSDALTDTTDLIPYIGVMETTTTAGKSITIHGQAIERNLG